MEKEMTLCHRTATRGMQWFILPWSIKSTLRKFCVSNENYYLNLARQSWMGSTRLGGDKAVIIRISAPIKIHWSKLHKLDFDKLSGTDEYKEKYRKDMIQWGEQIRNKDHGYFCRAAIEIFGATHKPIWIVSDIRRKTDVCWFTEHFGARVKTLRLVAEEDIRKQRGFIYTPGVDDVESECDLDDVKNWDWHLHSNGIDDVDKICTVVTEWIKKNPQ